MFLKILFFLVVYFCFITVGFSWNDDYAPENLPLERTVCLKHLSKNLIDGRSILPDEPCEGNEGRYTLLGGTEPKGSYALIPAPYNNGLNEAPSVAWPAKDRFVDPRLWHFTCYSSTKIKILGTETKRQYYRGEITFPTKSKTCDAAAEIAKKTCKDELGGNELLEECLGSSIGIQ